MDGLGRRPHGGLEVALANEEVFRQWRGQYWMDLLGAYLGAPVKEVYPAAEVTNWMLNVSTPQVPLRYWTDRELPPAAPAMMTATNPVAYGHTDFFKAAWGGTAVEDGVGRHS